MKSEPRISTRAPLPRQPHHCKADRHPWRSCLASAHGDHRVAEREARRSVVSLGRRLRGLGPAETRGQPPANRPRDSKTTISCPDVSPPERPLRRFDVRRSTQGLRAGRNSLHCDLRSRIGNPMRLVARHAMHRAPRSRTRRSVTRSVLVHFWGMRTDKDQPRRGEETAYQGRRRIAGAARTQLDDRHKATTAQSLSASQGT